MDSIFHRISVRRYEDKHVEKEKLMQILRAGMQAPSACNQQPWEFYVVTNPEKIKALSGSVDLVLLDVFMPKMDGLSFLEHLKNLAPSVSVIMITASQNKESLRTALAHGVADYIIKPFTFERFKAALLTFAERWRLLHEAEDFDQSDLDNIFHRGAPPQQFSKGIDADTLEKILASVNAASAPVSTQEVADDVGLSRISVRKYLSYLEENNRIQGELSYGGKGRPVKLYRAL